MNSHRPNRDPHTFLFEVVGGSCTPYMKRRLVDRESIRRVWGPSCRLQASLVWTTAYVAPRDLSPAQGTRLVLLEALLQANVDISSREFLALTQSPGKHVETRVHLRFLFGCSSFRPASGLARADRVGGRCTPRVSQSESSTY